MLSNENGPTTTHKIPRTCPSCSKFRQSVDRLDNNPDATFKRQGSFTLKLPNMKQIFDSSKTVPQNGSLPCEKKGLLQRMHSLSLPKSKENCENSVLDREELCKCNDNDGGETWFHTWPERGREREKKPTIKVPPDIETDTSSGVNSSNVILNQLPIAYDPVTKKLLLVKAVPEESYNKKSCHKRQPSLLSDVSSTCSDIHLPLMPLNSNPHSHTSLSSLSNYSSSTDQTNSLERSTAPPRSGLASFWQRAFNRKSQPEGNSQAANLSWNLFSRSSFFQKSTSGRSSCSSLNSNSSPTATLNNVGSSGLILHSRPAFLPAKCPEEELHHQLLHSKLLEESQRKDQLKMMEAVKRQEEISRQEEQVTQATKTWTVDILPQWESSKKWRKTRDLWWQGLPPSVRGHVWKLSIGNDLNVTPDLFVICLERAKEKLKHSEGVGLEASVDVIKLDLSRTFPHLGIFQHGSPFHHALDDLLSAYVCFRPDIGYVQGMSFLAAILLLNLDVADAFICFANLLNRPLLHAFFRLDQPKMAEFYSHFEALFKSQLPKLHAHFQLLNLSSDLYLQEWIYTLYSRSLPLDLASRVWDLYCRDGEDFIFRTALGILKVYECVLLELDFIYAAQLLTNLPEDIDGIQIFKAIEQLSSPSEKSRFSQILTHHLAKVKGH